MSVFRFKRGDVNFRTDSRYPQIRNDISAIIAAVRAETDGQMPVYAPQYDPSAIKAEQRHPGSAPGYEPSPISISEQFPMSENGKGIDMAQSLTSQNVALRSEEHTPALQSLMRLSSAV